MTATVSKSRPFPFALAALFLAGCNAAGQDESDYRRLWKMPEAFCVRYFSRHTDLTKIPPKDIAAYGLGRCAEQGFGMPQSMAQAAEWYLAASLVGQPDAQLRLIELGIQGVEAARHEVRELSDFLIGPIVSPYRTVNTAPEVIYRLGLLHETKASGLADPAKADRCFAYAAAHDHAAAQYKLGLEALKQGHVQNAYRQFSRAAGHGHADALARLAILMWEQTSRIKDLEEAKLDAPGPVVRKEQAIPRLFRAADAGSALAHGYLGRLYATTGVPMTPSQMVNRQGGRHPVYFSSDERSLAEAMNVSGRPNFVIVMDRNKALEHLEKAASMGLASAELFLGEHLVKGDTVLRKDVPRGLRILERLVVKGEPEAGFKLGEAYLSGRPDIPANPEEGVRLLSRAAERGRAPAAVLLAELYEAGKGGLPQNSALAIEWHEKSALAGVGASAMRLGKIYESGELGQTRDLEKAFSWHEKASKLGENGAAYRCGAVARLTGQKAKIAADYLSWSIKNRHSFEAALELAEMYVRGEAESGRNVDKAWEWAADIFDRDHDPRGICAVSCMLLGLPGPWDDVIPEQLAGNSDMAEQKAYTHMNPAQRREFMRQRGMAQREKDADDAVKMLKYVSEKGFREATLILAHLYDTGTHVPKSDKDAREYLFRFQTQAPDARHPPLFPKEQFMRSDRRKIPPLSMP